MIVSMSESLGEQLTLRRWFASGASVAFASCALGTVAILVAVRLGWI
jgi:hypothetical protein